MVCILRPSPKLWIKYKKGFNNYYDGKIAKMSCFVCTMFQLFLWNHRSNVKSSFGCRHSEKQFGRTLRGDIAAEIHLQSVLVIFLRMEVWVYLTSNLLFKAPSISPPQKRSLKNTDFSNLLFKAPSISPPQKRSLKTKDFSNLLLKLQA